MKLAYFWHGLFKRPHKLTRTVNAGEGVTVLVIHGLATSGNTWEPLVRLIDKSKWHVLGFDLLGFGISPKPTDVQYTVEDHAKAILASLDSKTKRKKMIIIGHSMGCLIATHIATMRPDMVAQLILYEPPLFADSPEFRSHARRKQLYFALYEQLLLRPAILFNYSKVMAKLAEDRVLSVGKDSWLPFERSLKNTIMNQQAYSELKRISVPTDIIYGRFDFVVTRAGVKKMLQANPNVTFHLVREMHDVTDRAAQYIIRLLKPLYY